MTFYSTISMISLICVILTHSTSSKYKGVNWMKKKNKWRAFVYLEKKFKEGGTYDDELNAAKRVNQMCDEFQIKRKNLGIDALPGPKRQNNGKSKYKGVIWSERDGKWAARIYMNPKRYYGGSFDEEIEAAKKVNQICYDLGIPQKNPEVNAIPKIKTIKITSKFKGISWTNRERKWRVTISIQNHKYSGGYFNEEIEAAMRVNQLCDELGIAQKNPELNTMTNKTKQPKHNSGHAQLNKSKQEEIKNFKRKRIENLKHENVEKYVRKRFQTKDTELLLNEQKTFEQTDDNESVQPLEDFKTLLDYDAMQEELESLIKILDQNVEEPFECTSIKTNLISAIRYGEPSILAQINLRTKNGESALSIAAKHGFSNIVQFLISKGAEKEHFTNNHHTPLSLAVSHDHLKVVQVLFDKWISPNFHEKPYLHLSPIFNVKSRAIAQLLVSNDAVTDKIYNEKNQSPLTVACKNGHLDVVDFFLDDGLDIDHLDNDNKRPFFYALTYKHYDVVNLLISKFAKKEIVPNEFL